MIIFEKTIIQLFVQISKGYVTVPVKEHSGTVHILTKCDLIGALSG